MSGLINFIKGLFAGIFGIFSKKKSAEADALPVKAKKGGAYFLELDEAKGEGAPAAKAPAAAKAEATPAPAAAPAATKTESVAAPTVQPTKVAAAALASKAPAPASTFAPNFLMAPNTNSSRRRPGANMSSFLSMARQAKTPV